MRAMAAMAATTASYHMRRVHHKLPRPLASVCHGSLLLTLITPTFLDVGWQLFLFSFLCNQQLGYTKMSHSSRVIGLRAPRKFFTLTRGRFLILFLICLALWLLGKFPTCKRCNSFALSNASNNRAVSLLLDGTQRPSSWSGRLSGVSFTCVEHRRMVASRTCAEGSLLRRGCF